MTDDELKALADLLACPFCNGEAFTMAKHWRDGMMCGGEPICRSCGATMPRYWPERSALSPITAWNTRDNLPAIIEQRAEIERLRDILDTERYKVAIGVSEISQAVRGRQWLSEPGRGPYVYDDERYQAEFGAALDEINAALNPLRAIARDWSDCPRDPLRVAANRTAALNPTGQQA